MKVKVKIFATSFPFNEWMNDLLTSNLLIQLISIVNVLHAKNKNITIN